MRDIYLIPDRNCIKESMELAKEYGAYFEYNDFFSPDVLEDTEKIEELIIFYKGLDRDRSKDTLHGAFFDVTIHSDDPMIRAVSEHRVHQCMEIADRLGIRGVIFHTNTIPNFRVDYYQKNWVIRNEKFWHQILKEFPRLSVFIENMFDEEPNLLTQLAEKMQDEDRFGVCFDYAHAQVFGYDIDDWMEQLGKYIKHMHINDNNLVADLHQSVGSGQIDWNIFNEKMKEKQIDTTVLVEIKALELQKKSLEYMQDKKIYPYLSGRK